VRSGGKVVKNVAGYDAHKLHIGALGTLGVIAEVTFKVAPLPQSQRTIAVTCADAQSAFAVADALRAAPLEPVSAVVSVGLAGQKSVTVLARFSGASAAVERLLSLARQRCAELGAQSSRQLDEGEDQATWSDVAQFEAGARGGVLLRAGARPSLLPQVAAALEQQADARGWTASLALYAGAGLAYARWGAGQDGAALRDALAAVRASLAPIGGYVVVEDAPAALRPGLDIWGPPPPTLPLMRALKAQWDPQGVLNPGRYAVGL
jgi:glycolate oxidase FAD binding subunit